MKEWKRILALGLTLVMSLTLTVAPVYAEAEPTDREVVEITAEHFPDVNFRNYIAFAADDDGDGWLSEDEIFYVSGLEPEAVADWTGIEYFTELESLTLDGTTAKSVDLHRNTKLKELYASNSALESLDLSANTALTTVKAEGSSLKSLTLGSLPNLTTLLLANTSELATLSMETMSKLQTLDVTNAAKLENLELSKAPAVKTLKAAGCNLHALTVAADAALETAVLSHNAALASVDFSGAQQLDRLEISNCALTELDLSQNSALSTLKCDYNKLQTLSVAKNKALDELTCTNNELACLNLGYAPAKITASGNVYPITLNPDNTFDLASIPGYEVAQLDKSGVSKGTVDGSVLTLSEQEATVGTTIICPYQCAAITGGATCFVRFQLKVVGKKTDPDPEIPVEPELPTKPAAPKTVRAKLCGHDDVSATWSKVASATGYKVYLKKYSAKDWTFKGRTAGTSFKMANLADGTRYSVKVVPYNAAGDGTAKTAASIYTLKKVAQPTVKKYSRAKVRISWKNIAGESGYQISKSTKKSGTNVVATWKTTSGKSKLVSAKRNKKYYYKVRAFKVVDGKRIYAPWSSVRAFKLK